MLRIFGMLPWVHCLAPFDPESVLGILGELRRAFGPTPLEVSSEPLRALRPSECVIGTFRRAKACLWLGSLEGPLGVFVRSFGPVRRPYNNHLGLIREIVNCFTIHVIHDTTKRRSLHAYRQVISCSEMWGWFRCCAARTPEPSLHL